MLYLWVVKLSEKNYTVPFLNLVLESNPVILHSNMNTLERWPDFYSFAIFLNILSGWSSSKNLETINAGEGMEKREPSCTW